MLGCWNEAPRQGVVGGGTAGDCQVHAILRVNSVHPPTLPLQHHTGVITPPRSPPLPVNSHSSRTSSPTSSCSTLTAAGNKGSSVLDLTLVVNPAALKHLGADRNPRHLSLAETPVSPKRAQLCFSIPLYTIMSKIRALAKKYHPDLGHPDASEAEIAAILCTYQDACDEWALTALTQPNPCRWREGNVE